MIMQKKTQIINCKIVDVKNKSILTDKNSIIIVNGKIDEICNENISNIEKNSKIIDLEGKYLIPAFINAHCHIQLNMPSMLSSIGDIFKMHRFKSKQIDYTMNRCIDKGITLLRDGATENLQDNIFDCEKINGVYPDIIQSVVVSMEGTAWSPVRKFSDRINHMIASLSYLPYEDIRSGIISFRHDISERDLRAKVDYAILNRNAKTIKIYDQRATLVNYKPGLPLMSQKNLDIIVSQAKKHGIKTAMHHFSVESFKRGVKAGVDTMVHIPIDEILSDEDIDKFIQKNMVIEPTLSLALALNYFSDEYSPSDAKRVIKLNKFREKYMDELLSLWVKELRGSVENGINKIKKKKFKILGMVDMKPPFNFHHDIISTGITNLIKIVQKKGIVALGNDGGIPPLTPAGISIELGLLKLFLNEEENIDFNDGDLLKIATYNSAESVGSIKNRGTISEGKIADFIVCHDNPLEKLNLNVNPFMVIKNGAICRT